MSIGVELILWHRCGVLHGSWRPGGAALFAASLTGGDGGCVEHAGDPRRRG